MTNVSQPAQRLYDNTTVAKARPVAVALWQSVHSWQFLRKEKQFFHSSLIETILLCSAPTLFYVNYTERLWVVEVMDWTVSQHIITLIRQYIASIELELERISTKNIWSGKCLTAIFYCNERKNEFLLFRRRRDQRARYIPGEERIMVYCNNVKYFRIAI